MKWLKRKLRNWVNDDDCNILVSASTRVTRDEDCGPSLHSDGFRLQVYKASGGIVVETVAYDERKDRHLKGLHVITDDKDLGESLSKIITYENLKL